MHSSELKHRLLAEVKQIASDLGKVPTREDFRRHTRIGEKSYQKHFGGYTLLLQAAGLYKSAPAFNPNDIFKAEVEHRTPGFLEAVKDVFNEHTNVLKSRTHDPKVSSSDSVLVLGDLHFPWANVDALSAVYQFIESHPEIKTVVQVGDIYDMFSWAKFPRSHLLYNPGQEIEVARKMAEEMWSTIQRMLPKARCVLLLGNHDIRPIKKCLELAPELEPFIQFKQYFQFPGVELVEDPREPFKLGDVWFMHGHLSGLGAHARKYLRSVVCGHTHRGGLVTVPMGEDGTAGLSAPRVLFELNAGYLGDPASRPMSYRATKINEWTLGFGYIDEWGPRFIPL